MDIHDCQCYLIYYCPVGHLWLYKPEDTHYFPIEIHDCATSLSLIQYWVDGNSQYFGAVKVGFGGNTSYFTVYVSFYGNVSTFRDKGSSNFQSSEMESQKAQCIFCFSKRFGLSNCNKLFISCVQALTIIEFQNSNLSKVCCQDVATNHPSKLSKTSFSIFVTTSTTFEKVSSSVTSTNFIKHDSVIEWVDKAKAISELRSDKD